MATLTARDAQQAASASGSGSTTKFVPIRPAFRPLLPKPAASHASHDTHLHEPTVVLKSQQQRRITKKRKEQAHQQHNLLAAAAVVASNALPATISPASLMQKQQPSHSAKASSARQSPPPGEDSVTSSKSSKASSPVLASSASSSAAATAVPTPILSLVDDTASPGTPFSLFSHIDDPALGVEDFAADAGFDGVAGLTLDQFDSPAYISSSSVLPEMDFFTSNMDMFS